jgi:hypothetical protein
MVKFNIHKLSDHLNEHTDFNICSLFFCILIKHIRGNGSAAAIIDEDNDNG